MKKLLFQIDTDPVPSVFDTVVGFDGGADHVLARGGIGAETVGPIVEGAIFTRGPKEKKNTALFVGGTNMVAGEALFDAVQAKFFGNFRVSVMLDSNGANTTAAAAIALLAKAGPLAGSRAVVLAGTGPVGMRAAGMLALEGAQVTVTGRQLAKTEAAAASIGKRFGVAIDAREAGDAGARVAAVSGADIVLTAGALGHELLPETAWRGSASIRLVADLNAAPPAGIGGIAPGDKGRDYDGKLAFGALGIGGLKLRLHRAAIGRLFDSNDAVLDAEAILALAKEMA